MTSTFEFEKREYVRIPVTLGIRYKFLTQTDIGVDLDHVHEGTSQNIGTGGILLKAKLPDHAWLSRLLTHTMLVGVNILIPSQENAVKALCRVAWSSAVAEGNFVMLGLSFQEISEEDRNSITKYVIRAQMPG